ncbi:MAG: M1 family aminopeptidase [Ignavibacteriaceae bacterium]
MKVESEVKAKRMLFFKTNIKSFLKVSTLLIFLFISKAAGEGNTIKINSYKINVEFAGNNQLQVKADVEFYKKQSGGKILFLIDTSMTFTNIHLAENRKSSILQFVKNEDTLLLYIPSSKSNEKEFHVLFEYTMPIDSLSGGATEMGYWYPYLFNNISKFMIIAKMPYSYSMFFPGILLKKYINSKSIKYIWETDKPLPRLFGVIAKSDAYTESKSVIRGKMLDIYLLSKDRGLMHRFKSESEKAFKFFSDYIGQYRYKSLTFIEVPNMKYVNSQPSFIMMGSIFLDYYKKNLYDWPPHEIAHQWFGSGIFAKQGDLRSWCMFEPLAEYSRLTFTASDSGKVYMEKEIKGMVDEYKSDYEGTKYDKPLIETGGSRVTYIKGTYVMNKISEICGQKKWQEFLEKLYDHFQGKFLSYNDFIKSLSRISNNAGKSANEMFTTTGLIKE